jgi:hypothetical protein
LGVIFFGSNDEKISESFTIFLNCVLIIGFVWRFDLSLENILWTGYENCDKILVEKSIFER